MVTVVTIAPRLTAVAVEKETVAEAAIDLVTVAVAATTLAAEN